MNLRHREFIRGMDTPIRAGGAPNRAATPHVSAGRLSRRALARWLAVTATGPVAAIALAPTAAFAQNSRRPGAGFYFGRIAFTNEVIGIAVTRSGNVRAMVTDAEPDGDVAWFQGRVRGSTIDLFSVGRRFHLQVSFDNADGVFEGTLKFPDGIKRAVATRLAGEGADLYDVTVRDGRYTGISTQGHRIDARQDGRFVTGNIIERRGTRLPFRVRDLSQAYGYPIPGGRPDRYTVIISRNATLHYGRGGDVRRGRPNRNLIALDIQASDNQTPGFFFGKVAFQRDVIGVKVEPPDALGLRRVRAYMSDSEPGGDLQWFTGQIAGDTIDLTSVTGDARLQATVTSDEVTGTLFLPGNRVRRFFALPAGDGAGIYDVRVNPDGTLMGISEEGATLVGRQEGRFVILTLRTVDGRVFEERPSDLTRVLRYPQPGNQPDTYVAVISPRGRFIFGRSGDVRGGSAGLNIIGLDKKC